MVKLRKTVKLCKLQNLSKFVEVVQMMKVAFRLLQKLKMVQLKKLYM